MPVRLTHDHCVYDRNYKPKVNRYDIQKKSDRRFCRILPHLTACCRSAPFLPDAAVLPVSTFINQTCYERVAQEDSTHYKGYTANLREEGSFRQRFYAYAQGTS